MHFPNKKTIELSFIEMGLFTNTLHLIGRSETHKKNIAQMYTPSGWYVSTVFLFFESSVFLFLSFYFFWILKTAISVKYLYYPFYTAGNQIVYWNEKEFIIIGRLQFSKKSSARVKLPCLNWGRITLTKPNNPINDCAPFLAPRSFIPVFWKKKRKKEGKKKNWQCGMKMKR